MTFLSIIIPTKNEERVLPQLLESLRRQAFTDYEIIVADAFSTDETREIAQKFGARVVDGGLPGPGRNRGAAVARGEILFFVDADAELKAKTFLSDCLAEMDRRHLDVATCALSPISCRRVDRALHHAYNGFVIATQHVRAHAAGTCIFIRRGAHERMGGFDERVRFAEDMEYSQRATRQSFEFGVLRSHPIGVSVRRFDKDGRMGIACKFVFAELRMIAKGPFTELPFEYEMGGE